MQSFLDLLPASLWPTQPFISPDEQARTLQALWALQAPANAFSPVAGRPGNIEGPSSLQAPDPAPSASDADHASAPGGILGSALKASAAGGILGAIFGSSAAAPTAMSEQDLIPPPQQGPSLTPAASTADQLAPHSPPAVAPAAPGLTHAPHPIGSMQPAWATGAQPYLPPQNVVQPMLGPGAPWDDAARKSLVDYAVSRGIVPASSSAAGSVTRSAADEITKEPPAGAALAPWSAKHGLLDWPVVAPLAGLTEYATRALANHVREAYSAPPDYYQMQHPGAGSLPHPQMYHLNLGTGQWDVIPAREVDPREAAAVNSTVSGVGNALISPFVAFKEAWDPPLHPPPNSTFDDGGTIYVDDANGVSRPWSEVDPKAAQAYYEQERRRADFAPSFALSLLGGGGSFAERRAAGMAGSRLGSGAPRPPVNAAEANLGGLTVGRTELNELRTRFNVPTGHTIAVGRTDVPGLEGELFGGASPQVRQKAGLPPATPGPIASPSRLPINQAHAEEDLANRFVESVERLGLKPEDLDGRNLVIHISNPKGVCESCRWGLNSDAPPGVLKQLSIRYPRLTIHISVETEPGITPLGPTHFTIKNGRYVSRSDQ